MIARGQAVPRASASGCRSCSRAATRSRTARGLGVLPGPGAAASPTTPGLQGPAHGLERRRGAGRRRAAGACRRRPTATYFYFVHSYYPAPGATEATWRCRPSYGGRFCAAVARDNVFALPVPPRKEPGRGACAAARFVAAVDVRARFRRCWSFPRSIFWAASAVRLEQGRARRAKVYSDEPWELAGRSPPPAPPAARGRPGRRVHARAATQQPRDHRAHRRGVARWTSRSAAACARSTTAQRLFDAGRALRGAGHGGDQGPGAGRGGVRALPAADRRRGRRARGQGRGRGLAEDSTVADAVDVGEAVARAGAAARALHRHRPRRHAHRARPGGDRRGWRRRIAPCPVIASGGVARLDDLDAHARQRRVRGGRRQGALREGVHRRGGGDARVRAQPEPLDD